MPWSFGLPVSPENKLENNKKDKRILHSSLLVLHFTSSMEKYEIEKLRELPIEGVAERLGLHVSRHKSLCPFHDDHHASLSFNTRRNSCRCYVCMTQGMGTIDLVMKQLHVDFPVACRWLADKNNIILSEERRVKSEKSNTQYSTSKTQYSFDAARYLRFFEHPWLSDEARHFLFEERRIDPRVAAWCRLTSWQDRDGTHWLQIPFYDRGGKLIGVQNRNLDYHRHTDLTDLTDAARNIKSPTDSTDIHRSECFARESTDSADEVLNTKQRSTAEGKVNRTNSADAPKASEKPRFRFPYGARCSVYNLPVTAMLGEGDELYITEGCSDCWAMLSAGHKAIAIPSATLLTPEDRQLLADLDSSLHLSWHMYPDNDAPGERLFLQLKEILPSLVHHQLPPGIKDVGEAFLKGKKAI